MQTRQQALNEITKLARFHDLNLEEIKEAVFSEDFSKNTKNILPQLFSYLGGILLLAGIGVFTSMQWDVLNSAARVVITLGSGFAVYLLALAASSDERYAKAVTPLFIIAAFLQPTGIFVMLHEYSSGEIKQVQLFMATIMLLQQGLTFYARRITILAFSTVFFAALALFALLDITGLPDELNIIVTGLFLMGAAFLLSRSGHSSIAPFAQFVGSTMVLITAFFELKGQPLEVLYAGLASFFIYLATIQKSRTLSVVSVLAMLSYLNHFSFKHFPDAVAWPIVLAIMGLVLIGLARLFHQKPSRES